MHADKNSILRLLKTVKGQIDGLIKMIENDRDCMDISTQILASQSILKKVNLDILKGHFTHCIKETIEQGNEHNVNEELSKVFDVLNKMIK